MGADQRFVCERLKEYCVDNNIECKYRELSSDSGYYAWHFYFRVPVELSIGGEINNAQMWLELQLTTQLAEVITSLTHDLYATRRGGGADDPYWKWDAGSARFRSSFIGHGLHLLEGVIQSFRDSVMHDRKSSQDEAAKTHIELADEAED